MPKGQYTIPPRDCVDCGMSISRLGSWTQKRCTKCKNTVNKKHRANWTSRNRERTLETSRKSYRKNAEGRIAHVKEYVKQHRDKYNEYSDKVHMKRMARYVEHVDRRAVYERDNETCRICGQHVDWVDFSLDHIKPLAKGGTHEPSNVQTSHLRCNQRKWKHYQDPCVGQESV